MPRTLHSAAPRLRPRFAGRVGLLCALLLPLAGCPEETISADAGSDGLSLEVVQPADGVLGLSPGEQGLLRLRLSRGGGAVAGQALAFAIYGDPRGSTLSADSAVTDGAGEAGVRVRAGAVTSRFQIQASAPGGVSLAVYVEVSDAGFATLKVTPRYAGALAQIALTRVRLHLFAEASCGALDAVSPSGWLRRLESDGVGKAITFGSVPAGTAHTLLGQAYTADGRLRAAGCLELPRSVPQAERTLSLELQLDDLLPRLAGSYALQTRLTLATVGDGGSYWPRPLAGALSPWDDLSDCPNDPAQALLDCLVDALDPGDPLDCVVQSPSAVARLLQAERGQAVGNCRQDTSARGGTGLDKRLHDALIAAASGQLSALAEVPAKLRTLLARLSLESTLTLSALDAAGRGTGAHRLERITVGSGAAARSYAASALGLPGGQSGPLGITVTNWNLSLASHGFSLPLGTLVRLATASQVLAPAGLGSDARALVFGLVGKVTFDTGKQKLSGCAAVDALLCTAARLAPGCLAGTCSGGLGALAARLDRGSDALDRAKGAPLTLQGSAELQDSNSDLTVDALGTTTVPGVWTATLELANQPVTPNEATFTGKRTK